MPWICSWSSAPSVAVDVHVARGYELRECGMVGRVGVQCFPAHTCLRRATLTLHAGAAMRPTSTPCARWVRNGTGCNCWARISASILRSRGSSRLPTYPSSQRVSLSNAATGNIIRFDMTALRIRSIARWYSPQPNSTNVMMRS
jgi:hypothetical protein